MSVLQCAKAACCGIYFGARGSLNPDRYAADVHAQLPLPEMPQLKGLNLDQMSRQIWAFTV